MSDLYFLDTNVLMYAVGAEHPLKKPSLDILRKVTEGAISAVTDTEVFQEIAYRYWSQRKWTLATEVFKKYQCLFSEIYPVDREHLSDFFELLSEYEFLSPRDAIHIAVMKSHRLKNIYTTDQAFKKIPFLKVCFPLQVP